MSEGKLVRDLIPHLIRESGRRADVRYLSGQELVSALGAKLREEAREAAEALDSRENLIDELADVTEVMFGAHCRPWNPRTRRGRGSPSQGAATRAF